MFISKSIAAQNHHSSTRQKVLLRVLAIIHLSPFNMVILRRQPCIHGYHHPITTPFPHYATRLLLRRLNMPVLPSLVNNVIPFSKLTVNGHWLPPGFNHWVSPLPGSRINGSPLTINNFLW